MVILILFALLTNFCSLFRYLFLPCLTVKTPYDTLYVKCPASTQDAWIQQIRLAISQSSKCEHQHQWIPSTFYFIFSNKFSSFYSQINYSAPRSASKQFGITSPPLSFVSLWIQLYFLVLRDNQAKDFALPPCFQWITSSIQLTLDLMMQTDFSWRYFHARSLLNLLKCKYGFLFCVSFFHDLFMFGPLN